MLPSYLVRPGNIIWPHCKFLSPLLLPQISSSSQTMFFIKWTGHSSYFTLRRGFLAKFKEVGHIWHLPLLMLQSLPLTIPVGSLCSWVLLSCGPVWCAVSPFPVLWVSLMWLINCCPTHLPSVRCHVFGHPRAQGWESLSHQQGEQEVTKTVGYQCTANI